jgi:hypothetical protein
MHKQIKLVDYEVQGYITGTSKLISTICRATSATAARREIQTRVPQLTIVTVCPAFYL